MMSTVILFWDTEEIQQPKRQKEGIFLDLALGLHASAVRTISAIGVCSLNKFVYNPRYPSM